jgi:hypothetical protein
LQAWVLTQYSSILVTTVSGGLFDFVWSPPRHYWNCFVWIHTKLWQPQVFHAFFYPALCVWTSEFPCLLKCRSENAACEISSLTIATLNLFPYITFQFLTPRQHLSL